MNNVKNRKKFLYEDVSRRIGSFALHLTVKKIMQLRAT